MTALLLSSVASQVLPMSVGRASLMRSPAARSATPAWAAAASKAVAAAKSTAVAASASAPSNPLHGILSFVLHLDKHLSHIITTYGTATYAILWAIVFW